MDKKEMIIEWLENQSTDRAIAVWNQYCEETRQTDSYIFSMEEFNDEMSIFEPIEIANKISYGTFTACDNYFWFNGYDNLESADCPEVEDNSPFFAEEVAEYCVENEEDFGVLDIQDILEE